ncbi:hypothetical protein RvY_09045 [Ramazzottius varieornatus]|uniref:Transmembrane protein 268 n=1 Tax=Ramazzottius varieornatus TaxID=947166 RepID=A0A1D1V842_RAMVA|nr:hypothetical protein RvY_09045 [Ramazzottius varieornatus]
MDHVTHQDVPDRRSGAVSPTWVQFEETGESVVDPTAVHVVLPKPPKKSDIPNGLSSGLMSPVSLQSPVPPPLTPEQQAELERVDRLQQILQCNPLASVTIPEETAISFEERENGKVLTTLKPANERCAWITPPVYHPEMVPQRVADFLQVPLEDYVICLEVLVKDYRFRIFAVLYKRLIGIWLLLTVIVLLVLLFTGLRGINLFVAGLIWLIVAGTGMCFCLYAKKKMNDGLRDAVATANKFTIKQRLIVGVDDRGKLSMHKTFVLLMYYDVSDCIIKIAELLRSSKIVSIQNGSTIAFSHPNPDMDVAQTSVMDKAETLLLRCVQPYVKEIARRRLHFVTAKIGEDPVDGVDGSPATNMVPRHCKTCWCLCQYVDRQVIRRKPRKWFTKFFSEDVS